MDPGLIERRRIFSDIPGSIFALRIRVGVWPFHALRLRPGSSRQADCADLVPQRSFAGRALIILWLLVYVPAYTNAYGVAHFLQLCDLTLLLSCIGYLTGSRLLLSAQTLSAPAIGALWVSDVAWVALTGHTLHGGTNYLWDVSIPIFARALSTFHIFLPALLLIALRRWGYDRRALVLQSLIAGAAIAVSTIGFRSDPNLNYVQNWPGGGRMIGGPGAHALTTWLLLCSCVYAPSHLLCQRWFSLHRRRSLGESGAGRKPDRRHARNSGGGGRAA